MKTCAEARSGDGAVSCRRLICDAICMLVVPSLTLCSPGDPQSKESLHPEQSVGFRVGVTVLSVAPRFCPDGVLASAGTSLTRLALGPTIRAPSPRSVQSSHRFGCKSAFSLNSPLETSLTDASGSSDINRSAHGFLCRYSSKF